jgi:DNA mismatch repair protein MutL
MSGPIRRLPDVLVNRIAAGEVLERPAAALKELVENALDAGARRISVWLRGGGVIELGVEDDGHGIPAEELPLAVERHATSKIADETLTDLPFFGFRGEALAAIGAVARLEIVSRPAGAPGAARIRVEGGVVHPVEPAALGGGTRVVMRDLFFAVPARLKFLKTARTETEIAVETFRRLALANPHVAFRLRIDAREVLSVPAQESAARWAAVLGPSWEGQAVEIESVRDDLALRGLVGLPALARASSAEQHLFVNRRPVRDVLLRAVLKAAYEEVLPAGRQPAALLFLDVPPRLVDVNVHPAKAEVRFRDPGLVRALVFNGVRGALRDAGLPSASVASASSDDGADGSPLSAPPALPSASSRTPTRPGSAGACVRSSGTPSWPRAPLAIPGFRMADLFAPPERTAAVAAVWVVGRMLLLRRPDGVLLADAASAARSRTRRLLEEGGGVRSLEKEVVLALAPDGRQALAVHAAELERLGFRWSETPEGWTVRAAPAGIGDVVAALSAAAAVSASALLDALCAGAEGRDGCWPQAALEDLVRDPPPGRLLTPSDLAALLPEAADGSW